MIYNVISLYRQHSQADFSFTKTNSQKKEKKKKVRYGKKEFSILILDIWTYPPMTP